MSQVLVTLDSLRSYARSLDARLRDTKTYPDSWIDSKIDTGYEIVSTGGQPFYKEVVLDLTEYITDGTQKFEVEMDEDVNGWKAAFYMKDNNYQYDFPIASRFTTGSPVAIQIKPDNKVEIDLGTGLLATSYHTLTFQYYYFPHTKTGDQYFSTDIYHMVRHALASSIYDALHDYEKRDNFDNQLNKQLRSVVNGHDMDAGNIVSPNWAI